MATKHYFFKAFFHQQLTLTTQHLLMCMPICSAWPHAPQCIVLIFDMLGCCNVSLRMTPSGGQYGAETEEQEKDTIHMQV